MSWFYRLQSTSYSCTCEIKSEGEHKNVTDSFKNVAMEDEYWQSFSSRSPLLDNNGPGHVLIVLLQVWTDDQMWHIDIHWAFHLIR